MSLVRVLIALGVASTLAGSTLLDGEHRTGGLLLTGFGAGYVACVLTVLAEARFRWTGREEATP